MIPPAEAIADLCRAVSGIRPSAGGSADDGRSAGRPRWTRHQDWHVTLAFLGSLDPRSLPAAEAALVATAAESAPVELRLGGGGRFGRSVLWIDVAGPLGSLAGRLRINLAAVGLAYDDRPFRPHLTLARGRDLALPRALVDHRGPVWTVTELVLMASQNGYREVRRAALTEPADPRS